MTKPNPLLLIKGIFVALIIGVSAYLYQYEPTRQPSDPDGIVNSNGTVSTFKIDEAQAINGDIMNSLGVQDNPHARNDFDVLRLRSPRTNLIPDNIRQKEVTFTKSIPVSSGYALKSKTLKNARTEAFNFINRGPDNVGGRTRALAFDMNDPSGNTILAGGVSGGMWRSINGGDSWTRTTRRDQFPSVTALVQDPRPGRQNEWYHGTGEVTGNSANGNGGAFYRGDGIYRSINSGQSWEIVPGTATGDITITNNEFRIVNAMVIDQTNLVEDEIYAAVIDGIIRTTDGFQTYEFVLGDPANLSLHTEVAITSTGRLYATVSDQPNGSTGNIDNGIWTSTDGINWTEIDPPAGAATSGYQRTSIGISPSNENIVYFLRTEFAGNDHSLFRYDASTGAIEDRSDAIPQSDGPIGEFDTQNSYDQYVKVHPDNSDVVYLGVVNLYRSTNGFANTSETQWIGGYSEFINAQDRIGIYQNHHPDQHALIFFPNNSNRMISSHDGGLSVTDNNLETNVTQLTDQSGAVADEIVVEWTELNNGYLTTQFYALANNKYIAGDALVMGGMQDNMTQAALDSSPTTEWIQLFGGDGAFCDVTYNSILASAQFAQIVRYSFNEETGQQEDVRNINPPGAGDTPFLFVNPLTTDLVSPNKAFVAGRGLIYYTLDLRTFPSGSDWLTLGSVILNPSENVSAMTSSVTPANQLFFGTTFGRVYRADDTNDIPVNVVEITGDNFPTGGFINCIAVDRRDSDNIFVVFSNYDILSVFQTTDGGITWNAVSGNLEENPDGSGNGPSIRWMEIMPNGSGNIYLLGTSAGLYSTETLNGMNTVWNQEGANTIGNVVVDMLRVRPVEGLVSVATHGNGVFEARMDVPLQASIFKSNTPCEGNRITIFGNGATSEVSNDFNLTYEWFVDGQQIANLNSRAILTDGNPGSYQMRLTNTRTGESALSNVIDIEYIYDDFCGSVITDLENQIAFDEITIFPNPTSDLVNLALTDDFDGNTQVSIYDFNGRIVTTQSADRIGDQLTFDISEQPSGYYFVIAEDNDSRVVRRFVKD
ncbi:MAG: T9SS type A sorting domain-containing protein [Bacteroidota bacterium]